MATNLHQQPNDGARRVAVSPSEAETYIDDMLGELRTIAEATNNVRLQYHLLLAHEAVSTNTRSG
ncbi:MAG: hypothetical protein AAF224_12310 [Pseudomonadota bacterium]